MSEKTVHRGGKKNRKFGRNKVFCQRYRAENRRVRNKRARLKRHLRHYPNDTTASTALEGLR